MNPEKFRKKFNFSQKGTLGLEEEIWIINNLGKLVPASLEIMKLAAQWLGIENQNWLNENGIINKNGENALHKIKSKKFLQPELPAHQIELTTNICFDVDEIVNNLQKRREELKCLANCLGYGLLWEAAPNIKKSDLNVFPRDRYMRILKIYQEKTINGFIAALHIHYGLNNHEHALRVINTISKNLMENFSFAYTEKRIAKYIGLAGKNHILPPQFNNWEDYTNFMKNIKAIDDPTKCWCLIRLNPIGTIELRIADVVEDLNKVHKIIKKFCSLIENCA